ncbi:DUF3592 domain-containing protein [bacterium]|nr:DUF3592 domain-containing protein [bacterium]
MAKSTLSKSLSGGGLALFGLPFLAAGLFLSWLYFSEYLKWWDARSWQEVPCWIDSTDLKTSRGDDSTSYKALATYRYQYAGRDYRSERVSFHPGSDNVGDFQKQAHRELKAYVVGKSAGRDPQLDSRKPFRCYVNPQNPSEAVLYRALRWQMQAFTAIFALTFPAVGAGLVLGGLLAMRASKTEAALRANHPGAPWKWKPEWAGPAIPETATRGGKALGIYTLWAAIVIFPLLLTTALSGAFRNGGAVWLLGIFAALWCVPAWLALRRLRHRWAVGTTRFELEPSPARPGVLLRGSIVLANPLPARGTAELCLGCEKRTTHHTGDGNSTRSEKLWSQRASVPSDQILRDGSGFRLPVAFTLPGDAPESGQSGDAAVAHVWKLALTVPGTPIHANFELPVFHAGSPPPAVVGGNSMSDAAATDLPARLAEQKIVAEFDSAGMPQSIVCPPARLRSVIAFLFVFNLVWTGVAVLLIQQHAPLLFRLVWPISAGVIWAVVFWQLLHRSCATFTRDGLTLRHQLGPVSWERRFEKSAIRGFSHDCNLSSGNASFYRVRVLPVSGKAQTLASGIDRSPTAAALAERLDDWRRI